MTGRDVCFQDNAVNEMRESALSRATLDSDLRETVAEVRTKLRQQIRANRRVLHQFRRHREGQRRLSHGIPFLIRREDSLAVRIVCLGLVCVIVYILSYALKV
ncbi:uncharacterized protein LOC144881241 [Branchiostoma floridae x Branchiostoma japonicum]